MTTQSPLNRLDKVKDPAAKIELARAHMMIALLGMISISLLWSLNFATPDLPIVWTVVATFLLGIIVMFSWGVAYKLSRKKR